MRRQAVFPCPISELPVPRASLKSWLQNFPYAVESSPRRLIADRLKTRPLRRHRLRNNHNGPEGTCRDGIRIQLPGVFTQSDFLPVYVVMPTKALQAFRV
jgi:hypothetical protein